MHFKISRNNPIYIWCPSNISNNYINIRFSFMRNNFILNDFSFFLFRFQIADFVKGLVPFLLNDASSNLNQHVGFRIFFSIWKLSSIFWHASNCLERSHSCFFTNSNSFSLIEENSAVKWVYHESFMFRVHQTKSQKFTQHLNVNQISIRRITSMLEQHCIIDSKYPTIYIIFLLLTLYTSDNCCQVVYFTSNIINNSHLIWNPCIITTLTGIINIYEIIFLLGNNIVIGCTSRCICISICRTLLTEINFLMSIQYCENL